MPLPCVMQMVGSRYHLHNFPRPTTLLCRQIGLLCARYLAVEEVANVPRVAQQVLCDGRRLWRFGLWVLGRGWPLEGQVNDATRLLDPCQRLQGGPQDGCLALAVARLAQLVSQQIDMESLHPRVQP